MSPFSFYSFSYYLVFIIFMFLSSMLDLSLILYVIIVKTLSPVKNFADLYIYIYIYIYIYAQINFN